MNFQFSAPTRIIFGPDASRDIPGHAAKLGSRVCVVAGRNPDRLGWLTDRLEAEGLSPLVISVSGEPDTDFLAKSAEAARGHGCDAVIAVGGGSVMDTGKGLAALLTNARDIFDYLEVVGKGMPLTNRPAPLIAAPTTAGTGSEATANAVLLSPAHGVKVSLRSVDMIPDLAIIDPVLTLSMPPAVTAATGMDALTQLMEAFVSKNANPMTDALCRDGMARAARSLRAAFVDGKNLEARSDMSLAALFSGMALANAKLGAVHGFAAPLGGQFHAPHGAVCAALLPHVMAVNIHALRSRSPDHPALAAYLETARILTGSADASIEDGARWIAYLCADLAIPGLASMGVAPEHFPDLAAKAAQASSMKGNPVELSPDELTEILGAAL